MGSDRDRNSHGQYADRIPAEAARDVFEERDDFGRPLTADDIMESLDCSRRTAHNKLNTLVDEGILETRKIGARGRVWWVPIETRPETASSRSDLEASPHPIQDAMDEIDLPGSGSTLEVRRDALLAAYDYLITNPSARKSDFLENVYPDHPAGFETEEGWWNAIQPALKDLPEVDPPEERGNIWTFLGSDRFKPTLG